MGTAQRNTDPCPTVHKCKQGKLFIDNARELGVLIDFPGWRAEAEVEGVGDAPDMGSWITWLDLV